MTEPQPDWIPPLSMRKFTVLFFFTGGLYLIPWYYRTLRTIGQHTSPPLKPWLRTVAIAALPLSAVLLMFFYREYLAVGGIRNGLANLHQNFFWLGEAAVGLLLAVLGAMQFFRLLHYDMERLREVSGGLIYLRDPAVKAVELAFLWLCWALPNPYRFIALLSFVQLRPVQVAVNQYLDNLDVHLPEETAFTLMEKIGVALCSSALLWALGGAFIKAMED